MKLIARAKRRNVSFERLSRFWAAVLVGKQPTDVGEKHGISQAHRMADVVRVCGRGVQYRHVCDEDNDSPACRKHDVQRAIHRLRIFLRNLPYAYLEPDSSPAEHGATAADAEADSRCRGRGVVWR